MLSYIFLLYDEILNVTANKKNIFKKIQKEIH